MITIQQRYRRYWVDKLTSMGVGLANKVIDQGFTEFNRSRNFYYNEKAAKNADSRQRKQYQDLYSPQAMMEQYAAAGLSPSMMMSGGQSAVGQSSAQGNQSAGTQGAYPSAQIMDPLQMAQIANINADTEGKKTDNIIKDIERKISQWQYQFFKQEQELAGLTYITDKDNPGQVKSLGEAAIQFNNFDKFMDYLRDKVNWDDTGITKGVLSTEKVAKFLRNVYEEAHKTEASVSQMLGDKEYANFMYDLYDKLNSENFAQLNADAQIAEMRQLVESQNLEADKKEVINKMFEGIENENLRAFIMILYMLGDRYLGSINGNVGANFNRSNTTSRSSSTSHNYNSNQSSSTNTNYNYRMR